MFHLVVSIHGKIIQEFDLDPDKEFTCGRSTTCSFVMENYPGISRNHLKIYFNAGEWQVDLISKFGALEYQGEKIETLKLGDNIHFSVPPYTFHLTNKPTKIIEDPSAQSHLPVEIKSKNIPTNENEDFNEFTSVETRKFDYYIKIKGPAFPEKKIIKLEASHYLVGRDRDCQIQIVDNHISRRQFELSITSDGHCYITDLGSANGTKVNAQVLAPEKPLELNSGDIISVIDTTIEFEVRDPNFNLKIKALQLHIESSKHLALRNAEINNEISNSSPESHINSPPLLLERKNQYSSFYQLLFANKVRTLIVAISVLALLSLFLPTEKGEIKLESKDPMHSLSERDQMIIKDTYSLAKKLYTQGKYELAKSELDKIHQIVPSYLDSKDIEEHCIRAFEIRSHQEQSQRMKEEQSRLKSEIDEIIKQCQSKIYVFKTVKEAEECLSLVFEKDPGNHAANKIIEDIEMIKEKERIDVLSQEQKRLLENQARSKFESATKLLNMGKYLEAKNAYKSFIDSSLPNIDNLKEKSNRKIASIDELVNQKIKHYIDDAKNYLGKNDFRKAIESSLSALKIDAKNTDAKEIKSRAERENKKNLRSLYEDSILEESVGHIEVAKRIWLKIQELDVPNGEYFGKAQRKLKLYGDE